MSEYRLLFEGSLKKVQIRGHELSACCPFHDDRTPSFSANIETGGWMCHAGCGSGNAKHFAEKLGIPVPEFLNDGVSSLKNKSNKVIEKTYDYVDESGKLVYQVVRYVPKSFRPRQPDGNGDWIYNLKGIERILYRLSHLIKSSDTIFVTEGEKDADRLANLGLTSTTHSFGASTKWQSEWNKYFRNREVIICADNDRPGIAKANSIASELHGVAKIIRIIIFPDVGENGDVSDWLNKNHTKEELLKLVEETPKWTPQESKKSGFRLISLGELLDKVEEPIEWLVEGLLPSGGLSILAGKPKAGKSTLARFLSLCIAKGHNFLCKQTSKGAVIYLALEEKESEVRKHFEDMGATGEEKIHIHAASAPENALGELRTVVNAIAPNLIIVDPLFRLMRVTDANDYAVVGRAIEPFMNLARETGSHVLLVHHMGKGERSGGDAILGSTALFAAVDTALLLNRTEKYRTVSSIQRYGDDLDESVLDFNQDTRTFSLSGTKEEVEEDKTANEIYGFLAGQNESMSSAQIYDEVEGRKQTKIKALKRLVQKGQVEKAGKGGKTDPFRYSIKDSGSVVPTYSGEPGNHNQKNWLTTQILTGCSGSRGSDGEHSSSQEAEVFEEGEI